MTLVIQATNFLCAYLIMRYGLFNAAVASAQADKEYSDALVSAIEDRNVIIEQKKFEKEKHWRACQYKLAENEPVPHLIKIQNNINSIPPIQIPTVSDKVLNQIVMQSVETIKKAGDFA